MREIKFRIGDKEEKKMYKLFNLQDYIGWNEHAQEEYHGLRDSTVLMQYTGLKDKKSKEIDEGDILFNRFDHFKIEFVDGCL